MSKLLISGISEEFGELRKSDWVPILVEDETILLMHTEDKYKKIWVLADEWSGKTQESEKKKEISNSISLTQTDSLQGGAPESTEVKYESANITLESLEELRLDELLMHAMLEHGEKKIREKLYCLYGYCKNKCKGCGD